VLTTLDDLGDAVDGDDRVLDVELRRIDTFSRFHLLLSRGAPPPLADTLAPWRSGVSKRTSQETGPGRSEFKTRLPRGVRHGANAAVIQEPAAVEHDALDALLDRSLGDG